MSTNPRSGGPAPVPHEGAQASLRRIRFAVVAITLVVIGGSAGYLALGFTPLEAIYQTVTTVTTVGFREVRPLSGPGQVYTIALILIGVGTALYAFGVILEALVEGHLRQLLGRRRMERQIDRMDGHVIICGWGRVGRAIARAVDRAGDDLVVVDREPQRLAGIDHPSVLGDISDDEVLHRAGISRARVFVAALETDADNLFATVSARALRGPDLLIVARARTEASEPKLLRAGADRVVNPQRLGGERMAAFALQPHVVDFLEVVMHDASLEIRLEEAAVTAGSGLAGQTIGEAQIQGRTGALLLAIRESDGAFTSNPPPATVLRPGQVLIAVGSPEQLSALRLTATG
ncbi:MAG: potassium channel protein [Pseudonocardiales bacterium]